LKLVDTIRSKLIRQIAGVTFHYTAEGEVSISLIVLRMIKGKLKVVCKEENLKEPDKISEKIEKGIPVWLSVTGRPVILRKLDSDPGENYLHHVLPNAREEEFVVSVVKTGNGSVFVSAVRHENMIHLVEQIHVQNIKVLGFSVGPASINALFHFGLIESNEIILPGYRLAVTDGIISSISTEVLSGTESYLVGNERLNANLLLPFTSAISYLINRQSYDTVFSDNLPVDEEALLFSKLNRFLAVGGTIFIFLLLLINFFVFSYYNNKEQNLSSELAYQDSFFQKYDSLRKEIDQKQGLVKKMGLSQKTKFGYYADCIAASVPSSINLTQMYVNPTDGKIKADKAIIFKQLIAIKGETHGSMVLNTWVKELKVQSWIKKIEIIAYDNRENKGNFELLIIY
jgi:hypothetical protein